MRRHRLGRLGVICALAIGALVGPPAAQGTHSTGLLPDLQMAPPTDFGIERKPRGGRWLRFETTVVNRGPGAFEVYGFDTGVDADGTADGMYDYAVTQRIQGGATDGGWADHLTAATMFYQGDGHNHWHVEGLQLWQLSFERTIDQPSDVLRTGKKIGFCFWDNYQLPGAGENLYHPSTTSACLETESGTVPMGLSVGWGDTYPANIAFQYIDIGGLPNGDYWLTVTADPDGEFLEDNESNNVTQVKIRISRKGVTVLETPIWP